MASLKNPTPDVSKAIVEVKVEGKDEYLILSFISLPTNQDLLLISHYVFTIYLTL